MFTSQGEVEGGLSWLMGALFDFSFVRSMLAPIYSKEGGFCYDPASLFFLELASKIDGYLTCSSFCALLRQKDKGQAWRLLAGIEEEHIPGESDLCHFRYRVGHKFIESTLDIFCRLLSDFELIKPKLLATDGQLEPSNSRYKGCAYSCEGCREIPITEANRRELCEQIRAGRKRLDIACPFPETVKKVQKATSKKGKSITPKVALVEIELLAGESQENKDTQELASWIGVHKDDLPSLNIKWSRIEKDPNGNFFGSCPKVPSDIEAGVGYHIDTKNPPSQERVFGYLHQRTTTINVELGLELPVSITTCPANTNEGRIFLKNRLKADIPFCLGQVHCLDAGYDQKDNYTQLVKYGVVPIIAYNKRRENLSPEALIERGYDQYGTSFAPCGRTCRSNGYNYTSKNRQYVCGLACSEDERENCPHGAKVMGFSKKMSFADYPRLIGPVQRGTDAWKTLYSSRTASERINGYDQEVIEVGQRPKLRGLKAFRFSGAIRTLAQLIVKSLNFVLNASYTLGTLMPMLA